MIKHDWEMNYKLWLGLVIFHFLLLATALVKISMQQNAERQSLRHNGKIIPTQPDVFESTGAHSQTFISHIFKVY